MAGDNNKKKKADKSIVSEKGKKKAKEKVLRKVASPMDFDADAPDANPSGEMYSSDADLQQLLDDILGLPEDKQMKLASSLEENVSAGSGVGGEDDEDDDEDGDLSIAGNVPMWLEDPKKPKGPSIGMPSRRKRK